MTKLPSGRFPFINLTKALERAQKIYEADKGGKGLKVQVAFSALGYSEKSSGGFQTVSALKQYGLTVDEGSNEDRSVKLTPEAWKYFRTEIDEDKSQLRNQFARKPPLMAHLLSLWAGGTVLDAVARTHLKTALGMNDQSARAALGIYKENLEHIIGESADEGGDFSSLFAESSDASEKPSAASPPYAAETPKLAPETQDGTRVRDGEAEWISNIVGRGRKVRILVSGGDMGPREISKLIRLLEVQQMVLEEDEDLL